LQDIQAGDEEVADKTTGDVKRPRVAVLIDAENIPAKSVGPIITEIDKFGSSVIRRAYGDFNGPQGTAWKETFARHAIVPHHQCYGYQTLFG
jgi:hypothetical protein